MTGWIRSALAGAVGCVLVSGCAVSDWQQVGHDAGHSGYNPDEGVLTVDNVDTLSEAWFTDLLTTASEPMVSGGRVLLTTAGHDPKTGHLDTIRTSAFEVATGASVWNRDLFSASCPAAPHTDYPDATVVGDELWTGYFMVDLSTGHPCGGYKNPVRLDPADGSVIAEEGSPTVSPAVDAGDVVVQTKGGIGAPNYELVVRDKSTFDVVWTGAVPGGGVDRSVELAPVALDGMIYVGSKNAVYAFALGGCPVQPCSPVWSLDLGAPVTKIVSSPGNPILFAESGTRFVAVERSSGHLLSAQPLAAPLSGIAIAGDLVYTAVGTQLSAWKADGSDIVWSATLPADSSASPVVAGGVVYVGRVGGVEAYAADGCGGSTSCEALTSAKVTGEVDHVTVANGRLFVVSAINEQATLTAFAPTG